MTNPNRESRSMNEDTKSDGGRMTISLAAAQIRGFVNARRMVDVSIVRDLTEE